MKICEFCDSLVPDDADSCASCGGKSFRQRCNNCGNEYKEGAFCPHCGVRAGMKPKVCPRCNAEYFSTACPHCGFIEHQRREPNEELASPVYVPETKRPRRTWLWVLGWIFMPAIPLTVLTARSKKIPTWLKAVLITLIWILYSVIVSSAQDNPQNQSLSYESARVSSTVLYVSTASNQCNIYQEK